MDFGCGFFFPKQQKKFRQGYFTNAIQRLFEEQDHGWNKYNLSRESLHPNSGIDTVQSGSLISSKEEILLATSIDRHLTPSKCFGFIEELQFLERVPNMSSGAGTSESAASAGCSLSERDRLRPRSSSNNSNHGNNNNRNNGSNSGEKNSGENYYKSGSGSESSDTGLAVFTWGRGEDGQLVSFYLICGVDGTWILFGMIFLISFLLNLSSLFTTRALEIPPIRTSQRTLMLYEVLESDRLRAVQAIQ